MQLSDILTERSVSETSSSLSSLYKNHIESLSSTEDPPVFDPSFISAFCELGSTFLSVVLDDDAHLESKQDALFSLKHLHGLSSLSCSKLSDRQVADLVDSSNEKLLDHVEHSIAQCISLLRFLLDEGDCTSFCQRIDAMILFVDFLLAIAVNRDTKTAISTRFFPALLELAVTSFSSIENLNAEDSFKCSIAVSQLKTKITEIIAVTVSMCVPARAKVLSWGAVNLRLLVNGIATADSFLHQAFIAEFFIKLSKKKKDEHADPFDSRDFVLSESIRHELLSVKSPDELRLVINDFNKCLGHKRRVFSFLLSGLGFNGTEETCSAWVDFGVSCLTISRFNHPSSSKPLSLTVSYDNIKSLHLSYRSSQIKVATIRPLSLDSFLYSCNQPNLDCIYDHQSKENQQLVMTLHQDTDLNIFKNSVGPIILAVKDKNYNLVTSGSLFSKASVASIVHNPNEVPAPPTTNLLKRRSPPAQKLNDSPLGSPEPPKKIIRTAEPTPAPPQTPGPVGSRTPKPITALLDDIPSTPPHFTPQSTRSDRAVSDAAPETTLTPASPSASPEYEVVPKKKQTARRGRPKKTVAEPKQTAAPKTRKAAVKAKEAVAAQLRLPAKLDSPEGYLSPIADAPPSPITFPNVLSELQLPTLSRNDNTSNLVDLDSDVNFDLPKLTGDEEVDSLIMGLKQVIQKKAQKKQQAVFEDIQSQLSSIGSSIKSLQDKYGNQINELRKENENLKIQCERASQSSSDELRKILSKVQTQLVAFTKNEEQNQAFFLKQSALIEGRIKETSKKFNQEMTKLSGVADSLTEKLRSSIESKKNEGSDKIRKMKALLASMME
ncbi:hypothetical protein RCL1_004643 [Eukaryota sp. TZLM3-RCL]